MTLERRLWGWLLSWVVRAWMSTWKTRVLVDPELRASTRERRVYAFWHGRQMGLLPLARRQTAGGSRICVMVSWSRDGALQSPLMRALGLDIVRGSSSRGGSTGLRGLLRLLAQCRDAAFAADGPRGPLRVAKGGAAVAALRSGARLVPVGCHASAAIAVKRAWDRFEVPLPFARVTIALGAPIDAAQAKSDPALLGAAIDAANLRARGIA